MTVYGGTAAESDDGVAMVGNVGFWRLLHIVDRRVLYGIFVDGIGHARLLQGVCQRLQQPQAGNPFVRDDQDALFPFWARTRPRSSMFSRISGSLYGRMGRAIRKQSWNVLQ